MLSIENLQTAKLSGRLPHFFGRNEELPSSVVGATIVRFGTFEDRHLVEGGGLVIDYRPANSQETKRVVLAFNDVAMWVEMETAMEAESESQ